VDLEGQQQNHGGSPSRARRRAALVGGAGLAALASAVPASGAFADGDGSGGSEGAATGAYPAQPQQGQPPGYPGGGPAPQGAPDGSAPQGAPDRPCPEDQGGGDQSQGQGSESSGTWEPAPSSAL
jgi:hypothetical protein